MFSGGYSSTYSFHTKIAVGIFLNEAFLKAFFCLEMLRFKNIFPIVEPFCQIFVSSCFIKWQI